MFDYIHEYLRSLLTTVRPGKLYGWNVPFECSEKSKIPKLDLYMGEYWYEVLPSDYIYELGSNDMCAVCIDPVAGTDKAILGAPLLLNYYTVFNIETQ